METANKISSNAEYSDIRTILKNQALHLRTYQEHLVTPMTEQTKEMLTLSKRLEENLKFNRSSFNVALEEFIKEIKFAQDFINKEGTEFVRAVCGSTVFSLWKWEKTFFKTEFLLQFFRLHMSWSPVLKKK